MNNLPLSRTVGLHAISSGTVYPSAARTTAPDPVAFTDCDSVGGVMLILNVTAAAGTGGLSPVLSVLDPASGVQVDLTGAPAITTTRAAVYIFAPGISASEGSIHDAEGILIPPIFQIRVDHSDSSSYTYSLGYILFGSG